MLAGPSCFQPTGPTGVTVVAACAAAGLRSCVPVISPASALGGGVTLSEPVNLGNADNGLFGYYDAIMGGWTFSCMGNVTGAGVCFVYSGNGPYGKRVGPPAQLPGLLSFCIGRVVRECIGCREHAGSTHSLSGAQPQSHRLLACLLG